MIETLKKVRRIVVGIVGFTILVIGVLLLVLPGPAFLVIPLGLGILATEFMWAKNLLKKVKDKISGRRESAQQSTKDETA
jgi:uncharacterized protein (TIGR02611 family)